MSSSRGTQRIIASHATRFFSMPCWTLLALALGCGASGGGRRVTGDAGAPIGSGNGGSGTGHACVTGETQSCLGPARCSGAQQCLPDRSGWTSCDCSTDATGGSGGTSAAGSTAGGAGGQVAQAGGAQGGSTAGGSGGTVSAGGMTQQGGFGGTGGVAGGASGVGGAGGTSTGGGFNGSNNPNVLDVTVTYESTITQMWSTCWWCRTQYTPDPVYGAAVFQMNDGYDIVSIEVRPGGSTYEVLLIVTGYTDDGGAAYLGGTFEEPARWDSDAWVPVEQSCVNFDTLEMQLGGTVAGSFSCLLWGGTDPSFEPKEATLTGTFSAVWAE